MNLKLKYSIHSKDRKCLRVLSEKQLLLQVFSRLFILFVEVSSDCITFLNLLSKVKSSSRAFGSHGHHDDHHSASATEIEKYTITNGNVKVGHLLAEFPESAIKFPENAKDHKYVITRDENNHLTVDGKIVIPSLHDTLEWVLDTPPNVHQFEEPPVINA